MTSWVPKGPPLILDPSQPDPYHHFRGDSGWESTGNQQAGAAWRPQQAPWQSWCH